MTIFQMFAVFAGWLTDLLGLRTVFGVFVVLAFLNVPFIRGQPPAIEKISKLR